MIYVMATLETINVGVDGGGMDFAHDTDPKIVAALVAALAAGAALPPVLVTTDAGNGRIVLDGHHRIAAYRAAGIGEYDALVIDSDDLEQLLVGAFDSQMPRRISDLDDNILVSGVTYRARTDHEWFAKIGG